MRASSHPAPGPGPLDKEELERLSQFRYQLRRFLRFSENAAREAGITAQQYHLLLHTQGFADRDWASIGELAERLQTQHHSAVALVTRCEEAGLVRRQAGRDDARFVEVHLTRHGRQILDRLALLHASEISGLTDVIARTRAPGRLR